MVFFHWGNSSLIKYCAFYLEKKNVLRSYGNELSPWFPSCWWHRYNWYWTSFFRGNRCMPVYINLQVPQVNIFCTSLSSSVLLTDTLTVDQDISVTNSNLLGIYRRQRYRYGVFLIRFSLFSSYKFLGSNLKLLPLLQAKRIIN